MQKQVQLMIWSFQEQHLVQQFLLDCPTLIQDYRMMMSVTICWRLMESHESHAPLCKAYPSVRKCISNVKISVQLGKKWLPLNLPSNQSQITALYCRSNPDQVSNFSQISLIWNARRFFWFENGTLDWYVVVVHWISNLFWKCFIVLRDQQKNHPLNIFYSNVKKYLFLILISYLFMDESSFDPLTIRFISSNFKGIFKMLSKSWLFP